VGLLTSPEDVLSRMAGDCQGQAATTVSLIFALETTVQAYCVETPFHWWTQAVDLTSGDEITLNSHGSAGLQGNVYPQPIDMVFTWFPPSCEGANCTTYQAHNRNTLYFQASPWQSLMIAYTGMQDIESTFVPQFGNGKQWQLVLIGLVVGVVIALYASYFVVDLNLETPGTFKRILCRLLLGCLGGVVAMLLMWIWAAILYVVVFLHFVAVLTFTLSFASSSYFNNSINTPTPLTSCVSANHLPVCHHADTTAILLQHMTPVWTGRS